MTGSPCMMPFCCPFEINGERLAEKIFIKFIDGTELDFPKGMTLIENITRQGKADQKYIVGKVNGEMRDLAFPISESAAPLTESRGTS